MKSYFKNLNDRLTKGYRTQILHSHFSILFPNKDFSKIEDLATKGKNEFLGYLEICALFCIFEQFKRRIVLIFVKDLSFS